MAITAAKLLVQVDADTKTAQNELTALEKRLKGMEKAGDAMAKVGTGMTVGLTAPIVAAGTAAVMAASDLNESMNKVNVVFGSSADAIQEWARDASSAFGMSQQQALEAVGTFGNLFTSMEIGVDQSAEMSQGLVQLAADLASFNNIDPGIALEKLRAGLVGEVEPLRTLGVNLSAAAAQQQAFAMGLADTAEELTPAILAQARYALIMEQTQNAQGDFGRTSDELANSMRIVKAEVADLAASFGQELAPYVKDAVNRAKELLASFQGLSPETKEAIINFAGVTAVLGPALIIIGKVTTAIATLASVSKAAWIAVAAAGGPITILIGLLGALAVAVGGVVAEEKRHEQAMAGLAAEATRLGIEIDGLEEYQKKIAEGNKESAQSNKTLTMTTEELRASITRQVYALNGLTPAQEKATIAAIRLKDATWAKAEADKRAAEEAEKAREAAEAYAAFVDEAESAALAAGLSGNLTEGWEDYRATIGALRTEEAALTLELENALANGWQPTSQKVLELTGALDENRAKQTEAASAIQEATAQMIYQQAAAGLDAGAALDLARAMGLISEADYAVAAVVENLKLSFDANADGMITAAEGAGEFATTIDQVYQAVADLEEKNLPVTLENIKTAMEGLATAEPAQLPVEIDTSSLTLFDPESEEFANARANLTMTMQLAATQAAEAAKPGFDQFTLDAQTAVTTVADTFGTADLRTPGKKAGEAIVKGFESGIGAAESETGLVGLNKKIIEDLKKLWTVDTKWANIGEKIIQGIAAGVDSAQGVLKEAIEAAVAAALEAALAAAGITSPSKLFAARVGEPISAGIAAGILQAAPLPAAAMQSVISQSTVYDQRSVSISPTITSGMDMAYFLDEVKSALRSEW